MDPNTTHFVNFQALLIGAKRKFEERWKQPFVERGKLDDFKLIQTLGTGSFGRVMLVKLKKDDSPFALKMLEKAHVVKTKQVKHTISEIRTMDSLDFPFLIKLEYFFKDNVYLCLVMPFVNGGEMFSHLRQQKRFSEELTRFYAAQVILAFEYMHFLGIIYRDLKPENILIDCIGYLKITDYGFCKKVDDQRTYTLCGTPEYLAPEIILSQGYNKSVDWWALGVLIFEMAAGYPPFYARDPMKIYEKIVSGKYIAANHFSKSLKDIIQNFLQVDRTKRIGMLKGAVMDIKQHVFFKEIIWDTVYYKVMTPPYVVAVSEIDDVHNFDKYTEVPMKKSSKNLYAEEFAKLQDSCSSAVCRRSDLKYIYRFGLLKDGTKDVKSHLFFKDFEWESVLQKKLKPPFVPQVQGTGDGSNFDFYEETPIKTSSKVLFAKEFDKIEL